MTDMPSIEDAGRLALPDGEIHVWYCSFDPHSDPDAKARYVGLLTAEEQARGERFKFARHRRQHLVTRALVRTTLSRYAEVSPASWRFGTGERGKPYVITPPVEPLFFNLSNTEGLVICAVSRSYEELGVDVEACDRSVHALQLAESSFAALEAAAVREADVAMRMETFFAYWTLKESYIKARGLGLAIPLRQFWFDLGDEDRISFAPELDDEPEGWWFRRFRLAPRYRVALAARCGSLSRPLLRAARCVP
jgi:4'-phosphopantetheinyl transferase